MLVACIHNSHGYYAAAVHISDFVCDFVKERYLYEFGGECRGTSAVIYVSVQILFGSTSRWHLPPPNIPQSMQIGRLLFTSVRIMSCLGCGHIVQDVKPYCIVAGWLMQGDGSSGWMGT